MIWRIGFIDLTRIHESVPPQNMATWNESYRKEFSRIKMYPKSITARGKYPDNPLPFLPNHACEQTARHHSAGLSTNTNSDSPVKAYSQNRQSRTPEGVFDERGIEAFARRSSPRVARTASTSEKYLRFGPRSSVCHCPVRTWPIHKRKKTGPEGNAFGDKDYIHKLLWLLNIYSVGAWIYYIRGKTKFYSPPPYFRRKHAYISTTLNPRGQLDHPVRRPIVTHLKATGNPQHERSTAT